MDAIIQCGRIAKLAAHKLTGNDIFRMAGATAFFTTFALPPMLMIIVRTLGLFTDRRNLGSAFINPLKELLGDDSTASMLQTIRSFRALQHNYLIAFFIFVFLSFVATTLFRVIRTSINQLWSIQPKAGTRIADVLRKRAVSVAVMLTGGLLFLSIQLLDAGQRLLYSQMGHYPHAGHLLERAVNVTVVTLVSASWFYILFRFLPDGKATQKITMLGALFTGMLFTAGKAVLSLLLQPVQVSNFYGVSGAFALVLLFMFYSSIFLYTGAAVIAAWSELSGNPIRPGKRAERFHKVKDG